MTLPSRRAKLLYLAFARMPTEKAHGFTIAKSCEAFAKAGADVTLLVPKRKTSIAGDVFSAYGLERNFSVQELSVPDLVGRFGASKLALFLHYAFFYGAVKLRLLFASRESVLYTRDLLPLLFSWLGYKTVFECHTISSHRRLFFFVARRAHRIITISQALKRAFVAAGFDEKDILVAPSGVDLSVFDLDVSKEDARAQLDLPQGKSIAVYTGNFTTMGEDKGLRDIIAALKLKEAQGVVFVAVGGSEGDIKRYRELAEKNGVADRVILRGHASQSDLAVYQKAADMLLMPFPDTPHYRSHMSPVKMFEYMASGRPIIASDLPTIREVLNDTNSYIVKPNDPQDLAVTLGKVVGDPKEVAARAKSQADVYSWDARSLNILSHILGASGVES